MSYILFIDTMSAFTVLQLHDVTVNAAATGKTTRHLTQAVATPGSRMDRRFSGRSGCRRAGGCTDCLGGIYTNAASMLANTADANTLIVRPQIKCPVSREITSEVPPHYRPQLQLQLEVLDLEEADFVQFRPADLWRQEEFVITRVKRNREWWDR